MPVQFIFRRTCRIRHLTEDFSTKLFPVLHPERSGNYGLYWSVTHSAIRFTSIYFVLQRGRFQRSYPFRAYIDVEYIFSSRSRRILIGSRKRRLHESLQNRKRLVNIAQFESKCSNAIGLIHYRCYFRYRAWLPDNVQKRHDTKTTYQVEIRYANNTNETFTFHGPPGADETPGPVRWTRPYFDCKRSNKWLVAAVSPIADIFPRHTGFRHIEYPT